MKDNGRRKRVAEYRLKYKTKKVDIDDIISQKKLDPDVHDLNPDQRMELNYIVQLSPSSAMLGLGKHTMKRTTLLLVILSHKNNGIIMCQQQYKLI